MRLTDKLLGGVSPNAGKTSIKKLVLFGDSWTDDTWSLVPRGSYYKVPNPKNHWGAVIAREMGINVVNKGVAGDLAVDVAANSARLTSVTAEHPTHATVMFGGNDIFNSKTTDQIVTAINSIISYLASNSIKPILMWYPITPYGTNVPHDTQWQRITDLRTLLQQVATANSLVFVDFFNTGMYNGSNGVNTAYYLPDGVHANSAGMPIIANYLMPLINNKSM